MIASALLQAQDPSLSYTSNRHGCGMFSAGSLQEVVSNYSVACIRNSTLIHTMTPSSGWVEAGGNVPLLLVVRDTVNIGAIRAFSHSTLPAIFPVHFFFSPAVPSAR